MFDLYKKSKPSSFDSFPSKISTKGVQGVFWEAQELLVFDSEV